MLEVCVTTTVPEEDNEAVVVTAVTLAGVAGTLPLAISVSVIVRV